MGLAQVDKSNIEKLSDSELEHNDSVPIKLSKSIFDYSINELESMDINVLRYNFMAEIKALENVSSVKRNLALQAIFSRLMLIQPTSFGISEVEFEEQEQRLYADLISTPGLFELDYVVDFLKNEFVEGTISRKQITLLLAIVEYYSTHSKEACDNFNYIFRSSDEISFELLKLYKSPYKLSEYFSEKFMHSFTKEELSRLFKFYFWRQNTKDIFKLLSSEENEKTLFIMSQLNKKVRCLSGNSSVFLGKAFLLFEQENFRNLLNEVYDNLVGSVDNEENFDLTYSKCDDLIVMNELINYISSSGSYPSSNYALISDIDSLDTFLYTINNYRYRNNTYIFSSEGIEKIKSGTFDPELDFKKITYSYDLYLFKNSLLSNIYGITMDEAKYIKEHYGLYINEVESCIMEKDIPILEIFKSIINIVDLDQPNFNDKLNAVRLAYLKNVQEKGFDYQNRNNSLIIINSLLNRMYMNTYNKILTKVQDKNKIIKYDDGVVLLDAGLEFNFLLTSLGGTSEFYEENVNMASKWNTAALSLTQGLCASFINNENLGVITLTSPILGFTDVQEDSLNIMGYSDLFTKTRKYDLRRIGESDLNRIFIPATMMADETRYGYNEILLDRFLNYDEKNDLKLQPSYVVFYKMSDNDFENNRIYDRSLKLAKDFGIPIIVIDVKKVKDHEKEEILEKENELFSSTDVKSELLKEIVTRYMNNYTGGLTMVGESASRGWDYTEDFSFEGMRNFFNELEKFIFNIEDVSLRTKWIYEYENVYLDEMRKYISACSVLAYNSSVKFFVLDDCFKLSEKLKNLKYNIDINTWELLKSEENPKTEEIEYEIDVNDFPVVKLDNGDIGNFLTEKTLFPTTATIIDLLNYLDMGTSFKLTDFNYLEYDGKLLVSDLSDDEEILLIEDLVVSYFFENCAIENASNVINNNFDLYYNDTFVTGDFDWNDSFSDSHYAEIVIPNDYNYVNYNEDIVEKFVSKIEMMDGKKFLEIFKPIIENQSKETGQSYNEIACILLNKKSNIRNSFEKLSRQVEVLKSGVDLTDNERKSI